MKTPNLFIVGFQKCGTSSLFDILSSHLKITGTLPKETFYLTDKGYDNYAFDKNIDNPLTSWATFVNDENEYILEASVCNFYQKNSLKYIKNIKNAKVIFVVRDPIERFISVYKYLYGKINGIPPKMAIDDFYKSVKDNVFSRQILKHAIEHGKYHRYIQEWQNELGEEFVHVVGMKSLIEEPNESINKIYDFLALSHQEVNELPHKNKSESYTSPNLHQKLVKVFGGTLFSNRITTSVYQKFFMGGSVKPILDKEIDKELKAIYIEEYTNYSHIF